MLKTREKTIVKWSGLRILISQPERETFWVEEVLQKDTQKVMQKGNVIAKRNLKYRVRTIN